MSKDAEHHEMREAQERAIASSLEEGEARERHLAMADRHADTAWLIRTGHVSDSADLPAERPAPLSSAEHGLSQAIRQSRQLLAQSHRILAESRKDVPPKG